MLLRFINRHSFILVALAAFTVFSVQVADARAEGPLQRFAGHWHGAGKISMSDGTKESITCRGTVAVKDAGSVLAQSLTCASASYKVEVSSQIQAEGNAITGTWSETTRGVTGTVKGNVLANSIIATVNGGTFSAALSLKVSGNEQYVTIKPAGLTDVKDVTVALKRS